jgi:hypothetical protein
MAAQIPHRPTKPLTGSHRRPCHHGPQPNPHHRKPSHYRRRAPMAARGPPSLCDVAREGWPRVGMDLRWPPPIERRAGANYDALPHRRQFLKGIRVVGSPAAACRRPTTALSISATMVFHPHPVPASTPAPRVCVGCRRVAGMQRG